MGRDKQEECHQVEEILSTRERRIQDVKHKTIYILERADAPIKFWC